MLYVSTFEVARIIETELCEMAQPLLQFETRNYQNMKLTRLLAIIRLTRLLAIIRMRDVKENLKHPNETKAKTDKCGSIEDAILIHTNRTLIGAHRLLVNQVILAKL